MAKLLLLVSMLFKAQRITAQEKSALKDLIIQDHDSLVCALEAFETEKDFDELEDTLHRICRSTRRTLHLWRSVHLSWVVVSWPWLTLLSSLLTTTVN